LALLDLAQRAGILPWAETVLDVFHPGCAPCDLVRVVRCGLPVAVLDLPVQRGDLLVDVPAFKLDRPIPNRLRFSRQVLIAVEVQCRPGEVAQHAPVGRLRSLGRAGEVAEQRTPDPTASRMRNAAVESVYRCAPRRQDSRVSSAGSSSPVAVTGAADDRDHAAGRAAGVDGVEVGQAADQVVRGRCGHSFSRSFVEDTRGDRGLLGPPARKYEAADRPQPAALPSPAQGRPTARLT
jgi:hypothetical protein